MAKMATRRTASSRQAMSSWPLAASERPRSRSGTTSPLQTMMARATDSTITMAVAAERPPTNASRVTMSAPAASGRPSTYMSAANDALGQHHQAGRGDRHHEQVDQHQIDGKQPGGAAHLVLGVVLHHGDVELPRQQHDAHEAQEGDGEPEAAVDSRGEHALDLGAVGGALDEPADAAEHGEDDEEADRQKGSELDERLGRDGDDEPFLVLGRVDVARAEQDGEGRHEQGDDQGRVGLQVEQLQRRRAEQRRDGEGHGLELQGDVGERAGDGDDRDDGADGLALAVARGQKVGDRGDVLALGQPHDAQQEAPAEDEQEDRAEVDGKEVVARRGGEADAAEERPGRAVDGQREGVDQRPAAASLARAEVRSAYQASANRPLT